MAKDLLPVLLEAQADEDDDQVEQADDDSVIEIDDPLEITFFRSVEEIHKLLNYIEMKVEEVKQLHTSILLSPHSDEETQQQLEDVMFDIKSYSNNVRNKIRLIEKSIEELESEQFESSASASLRIRKVQHFTLSKRFNVVMMAYNQTQINYRERCKKRIIRQLEITGRETTAEELEEMLEEGDPAIFTSHGIIIETDEARQALDDIEARHADIIKLENSIRELHDMFMDMAVLIERQGEMIDNIEFNVTSTKEHVTQAYEELTIAEELMSKARQKKVRLIVILTIVFIILLLIIIYL